jgi:hypothetical protein
MVKAFPSSQGRNRRVGACARQTGPWLSNSRLLEVGRKIFPSDDYHSARRNVKTLGVFFGVEADNGLRRNSDTFFDNGATNPRISTDVDIVKKNGFGNL